MNNGSKKITSSKSNSSNKSVSADTFAEKYLEVFEKYLNDYGILVNEIDITSNLIQIKKSSIFRKQRQIHFSTTSHMNERVNASDVLSFISSTIECLKTEGIISIQGNRILIVGKNQKRFSITLFEVFDNIDNDGHLETSWVINVSLNG